MSVVNCGYIYILLHTSEGKICNITYFYFGFEHFDRSTEWGHPDYLRLPNVSHTAGFSSVHPLNYLWLDTNQLTIRSSPFWLHLHHVTPVRYRFFRCLHTIDYLLTSPVHSMSYIWHTADLFNQFALFELIWPNSVCILTKGPWTVHQLPMATDVCWVPRPSLRRLWRFLLLHYKF